MSVWATFFDLEDDPPYAYRGSHVVPVGDEDRMAPGRALSLALVPSHITRDGRDDGPEDGAPWPWLRASLGGEDGVLDRRQAEALHEALGVWLEQTAAGEGVGR